MMSCGRSPGALQLVFDREDGIPRLAGLLLGDGSAGRARDAGVGRSLQSSKDHAATLAISYWREPHRYAQVGPSPGFQHDLNLMVATGV